MKKTKFRFLNIYLVLLLSFLFSDEICSNYILADFSQFPSGKEFILYMAFLVTVIFLSPIQSAISDLHCRKKSLMVALSFSTISIFIIFISNIFHYTFLSFFLIILTKGGLGNTLPLSLAGVADTQSGDTRLAMGFCTGAMAAGYLALILFEKFFHKTALPIFLIILFFVIIFLCFKFFYDIRDKGGKTTLKPSGNSKWKVLLKERKLIFHEIKLISIELKCKRARRALITFLLWEVSQYSIHMLNVDLQIRQFSNLTASMASGYLIGIFILKLSRKFSDSRMIRVGYSVCLLSILPFFFFTPVVNNTRILMLACYFFYNLGTVFLAPSLFSILAKEREPHEQGKIFGLLESTDTIAFLFASIAAISYNISRLHPIYIVSFSTVVLLLSWVFLKTFEKSQRRVKETT